MTATPDQGKTKPNRTTKGGDADPSKKRREASPEPAEKAAEGKRKQECEGLDGRFPEQCDTPLADEDPAEVMPDEKKADSRPPGRDKR